MATVRVEGDEERRALVDKAYACMGMAVDAALVSLGEPEPPLEVQVVAGEVAATAVDEQPGSEALHHAGHVVVERRGRCPIPEGDLVEVGPAAAGRAEIGVEGAVDEAELDNVACHLVAGRLRVGEPLVDARHELRQLAIAGPPFFGSTQRWSEARTSPSASAIRRPGGSSGPPWSSFRIPRIPAAYSRTMSCASEGAEPGATDPAVGAAGVDAESVADVGVDGTASSEDAEGVDPLRRSSRMRRST